MNFLAYKVMESFGREMLKAAAAVAITTAAAEVASRAIEAAQNALQGPQGDSAAEDEGAYLSFSAEPPQAAPSAVNVVVNVNSYNERDSRNKDNSARTEQTECTNVTGAEVGEACCDGGGCEECIPQ